VERLVLGAGDGGVVVTGADATEARLRSSVPAPRVLHLATHGFVRSRGSERRRAADGRWLGGDAERRLASGLDPMTLSGLALAGANVRDGGNGDDGILTALEASHLDLDGCDLVVLSACETARGPTESGEGVLGLVRGFQMAGAVNVVASLWKVDDEPTRLLMGRFYEGYLAGKPPTDALRDAARWLRDSKPEGKDLSAPRHWAAFVAYGR
jgi:CHAT domain-containing protein